MADKELYSILVNKLHYEGAEAWNKWRQEHPEVRPDFSGADFGGILGVSLSEVDLSNADLRLAKFQLPNLSKANLSGANLLDTWLTQANLRNANLEETNLIRANLSASDLTGASLKQANFSGAKLSGAKFANADLSAADFSAADLTGCDFTNANLVGVFASTANFSNANLTNAKLRNAILLSVNFSSADLTNADFSEAELGFTLFANNDLSVVTGLDSVQHFEPSSVGTDTLLRSRGKIPEAFLRGAGVPDSLISYIATLVEPDVNFYSCFISYSGKDQDFASRLYADLQAAGIRSWFAPEDLRAGERFSVRIEDAIRKSDKLLIVLSESSVESQWVSKEVEDALSKEHETGRIVIFPINLDDAVFKAKSRWAQELRETKQIGDFKHWKNPNSYKKALSRLIKDLTLSLATESSKQEQEQ